MDETNGTTLVQQNPSQAIFMYQIRGGTMVLALNSTGNRLIAAGQQNFQLLGIEQVNPNEEQFIELYDFRNISRQLSLSRFALQPKDVAWNPNDEHCFASASSHLHIWDASRVTIVSQLKIHNATINRLQFHPTNPKLLLTASQDGYAKLIDFRTNNTNKVVASFRHISEDGFRDVAINVSNPNLFAAALNDQCIVPLWDIRRIEAPAMSLSTADRTQCLAWNPHEPYWLVTGGRDRYMRVWNVQDCNSRQDPLFTVHTFGQVAKLSWRPTCRYHIASSTTQRDPRIHVWDIRRAYLPQASFCHHQNTISDFLWRPNSDVLISVSRLDERLVHANFSTASKSEQLVSFFSLNVTSKGVLHVAMPAIENDFVRTLRSERHVPPSVGISRLYAQETMATFLKWNKTIKGKTILGNCSDRMHDNSIELFHQFARQWIFGTGDRSSAALAHVCDVNSAVAEQLKRPDLQATWQVIKMIYADHDGLQHRFRSSRNTPSTAKIHHTSDAHSISGHRHHPHHHHPHQAQNGKLLTSDKQPQETVPGDDLSSINRKLIKSEEQLIPSSSQMEIIDDTDTYIVRDVLTDDIIFVTPEDALNSSNNGYDMLYDNELDIDVMRDQFGMPMPSNDAPTLINDDGENHYLSPDRLARGLILIGGEFEPTAEYDDPDGNMQTSTHSMPADGSDHFFTIDESYCPTMQTHPLNFDDVIRQTLFYYVENNELQVAVHILLALYPKLPEHKRIELFNGAHFEWIVMYIELLQQMRLFVKAKQVTRHCVEKENIPLRYDPMEYDGTLILNAQSSSFKQLPFSSLNTAPSGVPPLTKDFMCAICRLPCRGVFTFCVVCFHGGHIQHIRTWFHTHDECPCGCGHRCKDRDGYGRSQKFASRSSFVFQQ